MLQEVEGTPLHYERRKAVRTLGNRYKSCGCIVSGETTSHGMRPPEADFRTTSCLKKAASTRSLSWPICIAHTSDATPWRDAAWCSPWRAVTYRNSGS